MSKPPADLPVFARAAPPKSILKKTSTIALKEQRKKETELKVKSWYGNAMKKTQTTTPSNRGTETLVYAYAPTPKEATVPAPLPPAVKLPPAVPKYIEYSNDRKRSATSSEATETHAKDLDFDVPRKKPAKPNPPQTKKTEESKSSEKPKKTDWWNIFVGKGSRDTTPSKPTAPQATPKSAPQATPKSAPQQRLKTSPSARNGGRTSSSEIHARRCPLKTPAFKAPPVAQAIRSTLADNSPEEARTIAQEALAGISLKESKNASGTSKRAKKEMKVKATTPRAASDKKKTSPKNGVIGGKAPPAMEIFAGTPDDDVGIDWTGWTKKTFKRQSGKSAGSTDSYWYTPNLNKKLRSIKEVQRFLEHMKNANNEEAKAWKLLKGK